jgi:PAS domain-containing protein
MAQAQHPHEQLLQEVQKEFAQILEGSSQGIYVYLDDPHWICNQRMASLLGYASPAEVITVTAHSPLLDALVAPASHNTVVDAYMKAVNDKLASVVSVIWKKKDGATFRSQTVFVPFSFKGTAMTIHFIAPS